MTATYLNKLDTVASFTIRKQTFGVEGSFVINKSQDNNVVEIETNQWKIGESVFDIVKTDLKNKYVIAYNSTGDSAIQGKFSKFEITNNENAAYVCHTINDALNVESAEDETADSSDLNLAVAAPPGNGLFLCICKVIS